AAEEKGGAIAASNQLSFVGIALASVVFWALTSLVGLSIPHVFLFGGLMTLLSTAYAVTLMPDSLMRLIVWVLVHSVYRIREVGRENIPAKGGALFVCNHLSLIDALLLAGSTQRPIRFLIYTGFYDHL